MSAADSTLAAEPSAAAEHAAGTAAAPPRRRLFRKYALLLVSLVGATLLVTSGFEFSFSYQENKATLIRIQQEKADAAAARVHDFVEDIQRQIGWTTHAQWAASPLDQRRQDYFRLLRQVPPITELTQLDSRGREQLKVSRLSMDAIGSEADFSQSPAFTEAKARRVWFSPVYFRKQSEPYMTLAVANDGRTAGVTVAEINLKLILDVIAGLKVGEGGYAYVLDGRGRLIAHPDISLVLRDTNLSHLPQVAAALPPRDADASGGGERGGRGAAPTVAQGLGGGSVLTAHTRIDPLGWLVFVEVPLREAFAPLYGAALRTGILLLLGLAAATLVALLLARRMTGPIRAITEGAERLGRGELDRRLEIHTGDEIEALAGQFNRMAGDLQQSYAELEQRVRDRTAELTEALDQQTATAEVLGVINASPGDLAPVFDAMLEKATRLCEGTQGVLWPYDGERFRPAAMFGVPPEFASLMVQAGRPGPLTPIGRIAAGERLVEVVDLAADQSYQAGEPVPRVAVEIGGFRSFVAVALVKDERLLGAFAVSRREVRPFTDKQIALLQNFAAQAVIAMENARLITETREALEQQTATAEVLGVINSSPGDLAPVFETILEKAHNLCGIAFGSLQLYDGGKFRAVAVRGAAQSLETLLRQPMDPVSEGPPTRLLRGERFVQVADIAEFAKQHPDIPRAKACAEDGLRTALYVPLRRDVDFLGYITAYRREVRPFTEKEIALLENFAAQAVIAMENARLITETREALEQQTATAEVLQVINSSPGDLAPVFDAMLAKAMDLCGAAFGFLTTYDGERFTPAAMRGVPQPLVDYFATGMDQPSSAGEAQARILAGENVVHNLDQMDEEPYRSGSPLRRAVVDLGGARSALVVALRKDGAVLGALTIYRKEVRPFSDKEIALMQNFAAQAVIAMDNARLITETRARTRDLQESLEYQTATSDVLKVISQSTFDLQPVLETVAETAGRLCESDMVFILRREGEVYRAAAALGWSPEYRAFLDANPIVPSKGTLTGRVAEARQAVHIADISADPEYTLSEAYTLGNARTQLGVPLMREGSTIGVMILSRQRVEPFTAKQIELVTTFADQAVIAIENARLLNELRDRTRDLQESLEYQTATSDVLKVISQSDADLRAVLQTVLDTAASLCEAGSGNVFLRRGERLHLMASLGVSPENRRDLEANPIAIDRKSASGRAVVTGQISQIPDIQADPEYGQASTVADGVRTMLGVPLLREEVAIGSISLARRSVQVFTSKQVELVRTFADQAVIAIENARLLNELRERTDELAHSVEELKTLSEVGQAVSSTLDLGAVLSTILGRSVGLTGSDAGAIFRYRRAARSFRLFDTVGWDEALVGEVRKLDLAEDVTAIGEATTRRAPVQIADLERRASNPLRDVNLAAGYRSALIVPLVGADRIFGAIVLQRRAAGEFPEATVRLMQTLASQSVLAIQNARLFNEIAEKSEQLAEASRHKSQFLANMSHELRTPLNAVLGYTELMVDGIYGELPPRAAGVLERVQNNGKHLLALINDVLDLAKIEAGQLTLTLEDYALPDVVQSVVSATEGLANTKGLQFTAEIAPALPTGHGDARRLAQVLLNLVGNAVKFTDAGEVAIRAAAENGSFVLTVRDTGPGISPADHRKIFDEFQQVDSSNTRKKGGTGLGLAISKRMVEMQGGTITVDSELGKGATFRVSLPVRVEDLEDELGGAVAGEMRGAA